METIVPAAVEAALGEYVGRTVRLHLETTAGAYTQGGYGAFLRNVPLRVAGAGLRGAGPFRLGLRVDDGWVYAEGLTHWERDGDGRLLLAGHDADGRLQVACTLSPAPLAVAGEASAVAVGGAAVPAGGAAVAAGAEPGRNPPERAVVVVLAHPDDETFGSGGTIALLARAGVPVTLVCATRGEMGRNMGRPFFANRETLRGLRERELVGACAALGIRYLRLLGVWDKTTEFLDPEALADRVGAILAEVRPSLVITSHPQHGVHPDHCAIGEATLRAVRRLPPSERPRVRCSVRRELAEEVGLPVEVVDVAAALDAKLAALHAHRSQSEPVLARLAAEEAEKRRDMWMTERFVDLEPGSGA